MSGIVAYLVFFACVVLILAIVTLGLNLQWGFTGLFNAGVAGFYAIGGYTHAILTAAPAPGHLGNLGWPWAAGVVAAMAVTALAALAIGAEAHLAAAVGTARRRRGRHETGAPQRAIGPAHLCR